jgi:hypothetical protein
LTEMLSMKQAPCGNKERQSSLSQELSL